MYIVIWGNECGTGATIEEAVNDFETLGYSYDEEDYVVYKAKEIKVKRKFEIVEGD